MAAVATAKTNPSEAIKSRPSGVGGALLMASLDGLRVASHHPSRRTLQRVRDEQRRPIHSPWPAATRYSSRKLLAYKLIKLASLPSCSPLPPLSPQTSASPFLFVSSSSANFASSTGLAWPCLDTIRYDTIRLISASRLLI